MENKPAIEKEKRENEAAAVRVRSIAAPVSRGDFLIDPV
jgi:hypothetical protein